MKKIKGFIIILLFFIPLLGCNNKTDELTNKNQQLIQENEKLISQIDRLITENQKYNGIISDQETNIKKLKSQITNITDKIKRTEEEQSMNKRYDEYDEGRKKDAFNYLKNKLMSDKEFEIDKLEIENLFEPDFVSVGDVIGDSEVTNTYISDSLRIVEFKGEYQVTGSYSYDAIGNILRISNFKNQLPYTIYDINRETFNCEVSNQEEFIKELGEYFKPELEYQVKLKAVFKNLQYNIQYDTDRYSTVEFVKLIKIIE